MELTRWEDAQRPHLVSKPAHPRSHRLLDHTEGVLTAR
jgi:hypothetical protein